MTAEHLKSDERYQKLQAFAEAHPDAVIAPHILKHWEQINSLAEEACRVSLSGSFDAAEAFNHATAKAPPLLPDVLRYILSVDNAQLDKLEMAERYLKEQGFTSDSIDFYTCGGEALVFTVKGCPDALLKVTKEYKMPSVMPFVVKPFAKAVFPMSRWESQDSLHAVEEYDPYNAEKNLANSKLSGSTEQLSLALVPRLAGHYMSVQKVGDPSAVSYSNGHQRAHNDPPKWSVELKDAINRKLAGYRELDARMASVAIRGAKDLAKQVNRCVPFPGNDDKEYSLNDQKYNNFGAFHGFENLPFILDKRAVAVENKYKKSHYSFKPPEPNADTFITFSAYYEFMELVRQVYHEKYGVCDKAFSAIAEKARTSSQEAWRSHLQPDAGGAVKGPLYHL